MILILNYCTYPNGKPSRLFMLIFTRTIFNICDKKHVKYVIEVIKGLGLGTLLNLIDVGSQFTVIQSS